MTKDDIHVCVLYIIIYVNAIITVVHICACLDVCKCGLYSSRLYLHTNFSPFLLLGQLDSSRPQLTLICVILHLQCHTVSLSRPTSSLRVSLSESALILPSIVPSPPITQNQEKHTPTRDWGSDKIKNTRQLIWIKGARSIRIERDSEPDRGRDGCREGGISNKNAKEKAGNTHTLYIKWPFLLFIKGRFAVLFLAIRLFNLQTKQQLVLQMYQAWKGPLKESKQNNVQGRAKREEEWDWVWFGRGGGEHMEDRSQVGDVHAKRGRVMSRGESNRVTLC